MKKNLRTVLTLLLVVVFCGNAKAQKGMHGIGVNLVGSVSNIYIDGEGYSSRGIGIGSGVKYQYNISNYVRIEPSLIYCGFGEHNNKTGADAAWLVNFDMFVLEPRAVRPYLFAGVGGNYSRVSFSDGGELNRDEFALDAGIGLDWRVTHTWSLQMECGTILGLVAEGLATIGCNFSIGLYYNF